MSTKQYTVEVYIRGVLCPLTILGFLPNYEGTGTIVQMPKANGGVHTQVFGEEDLDIEELAAAWEQAREEKEWNWKSYRDALRIAELPSDALMARGVRPLAKGDHDLHRWVLFTLANLADQPIKDLSQPKGTVRDEFLARVAQEAGK